MLSLKKKAAQVMNSIVTVSFCLIAKLGVFDFQPWKLYIEIQNRKIYVWISFCGAFIQTHYRCVLGEREMQCKCEEARQRVRFGWLWSKPITFFQRFLSVEEENWFASLWVPQNLCISAHLFLFFFSYFLLIYFSCSLHVC